VVIQDPHLDGDVLTYSIKLLDGTVPALPGHVRCSSTPSGVPCHRSPQPGCIGGSVGGAEGSKALANRDTLLVPEERRGLSHRDLCVLRTGARDSRLASR
jgi:hypothetical protein